MNLKEKFLDRKGFKRERTLNSMKSNKWLKAGDTVLVADTGYFYIVTINNTDIPLQNNLFAELKETSFLRKLLQHIQKLVSHSEPGHMSSQDKIKVDGIEPNANNYVHPTTSGYRHVPSGGTPGQILVNLSDGSVAWSDPTYSKKEIDNLLSSKLNIAGGAITGNLSVHGVLVGNNNITAYSDERIKTNIKKIKKPLAKLKLLNGYSYEKNGKVEIGVLAQELEKVFPELVHKDLQGIKMVDYGLLAGFFIECLKAQQDQINYLKSVR